MVVVVVNQKKQVGGNLVLCEISPITKRITGFLLTEIPL